MSFYNYYFLLNVIIPYSTVYVWKQCKLDTQAVFFIMCTNLVPTLLAM